jgi:pimeloyl-ACP methyl ester carboxylesterase
MASERGLSGGLSPRSSPAHEVPVLYAPVSETLAAFQRLARHHHLETPFVPYHLMSWRLEDWTPDCPLLVCLHGFKNNGHSFADLIPRLDRPAVTLDLQGHGLTGMPDRPYIAIADYLGDVKRVLDHLGARRIVLIGHSLGARVSAAWSALYPDQVERLVMIDAFYQWYAAPDWPARLRRWLDQIDRPVPPALKVDPERLEAFFLRQTPGMAPILARYLAANSFRTLEDGTQVADWSPYHHRATPTPFDDRQMREALLGLTMPTLALQCLVPPEGSVEFNLHNPNLRIERIDGGHMLHWERPLEVAAAIARWWGPGG